MPVVPSSLDSLLFLFAGAFDARTFQTFRYLVVGLLARVGEHSVCGMLVGARLERVWHHSLAHAFFAERKWLPDKLGLILLDFVVGTFLPPDAPIKLAIDDTLFRRSGKQVHGAAWQYDGSQPSGQGPKLGYGNNWVIVTLIVRLPFMKRAVSLPVLSRLWQPDPEAKQAKQSGARKRKRNPEYPSKPELGREILDLIAQRFPDRKIKLVGDSAYATKAFHGVPERVMLTSRLKSNAQLYAPKPPRTGKRGQPAKKGKRLPKLAEIAAAADWEQIEVTRSGRRQQMHVHAFEALFYDVWGQRPVQVVLARRLTRTEGYDIALVSMDTTATAAQIIEDYDERWSIEVAIEDAKQITGVGQARNRVQRAVERTVPFGLLCQSLVICWYALNGRAEQDVAHHRRHARWYRHKRNPSYHDMLASLRRENIAAEYSPVTGRAPKPREISSAPAAPKAATG
jgi:SRSO17 transposase